MKTLFWGIAILLNAATLTAQHPLQKVLKTYFRSHPFDRTFSSFIISLQQDPLFTIDTYERRTDSGFFYLAGHYTSFNPFRYNAKEVKLIIAEGAFVHADSLHTLDTLIHIQLMGITDTGLVHQPKVIKEFNRFHSAFAAQFWKNSFQTIQPNGNQVAGISSYFIFPFSISPLTIAWGPLPETNQFTFTITIRCKVKQNVADLVLSPDGL
jgi:hypothetical protein